MIIQPSREKKISHQILMYVDYRRWQWSTLCSFYFFQRCLSVILFAVTISEGAQSKSIFTRLVVSDGHRPKLTRPPAMALGFLIFSQTKKALCYKTPQKHASKIYLCLWPVDDRFTLIFKSIKILYPFVSIKNVYLMIHNHVWLLYFYY